MSLDSGDGNRSRSSSRSSSVSSANVVPQSVNVGRLDSPERGKLPEESPDIDSEDRSNVANLPSVSPARSESCRSEKSMSISPNRSQASENTELEQKPTESPGASGACSGSGSEDKQMSRRKQPSASPERETPGSRSRSSSPADKKSGSSNRSGSKSSSSSASSQKVTERPGKSLSRSPSTSSVDSKEDAGEVSLVNNNEITENDEGSLLEPNTVSETAFLENAVKSDGSDLLSIPLPNAPLPAPVVPAERSPPAPDQEDAHRRHSASPPKQKSPSKSPGRKSRSKTPVRGNASRVKSRSRTRSPRRYRYFAFLRSILRFSQVWLVIQWSEYIVMKFMS